jgi:transposase InsO family protein
VQAADRFSHPTSRVHQLWQTDFTYFAINGWGWYYLACILDDFSRYIITWKLHTSMETEDVKNLLEQAVVRSDNNALDACRAARRNALGVNRIYNTRGKHEDDLPPTTKREEET